MLLFDTLVGLISEELTVITRDSFPIDMDVDTDMELDVAVDVDVDTVVVDGSLLLWTVTLNLLVDELAGFLGIWLLSSPSSSMSSSSYSSSV